MQGFVSVSGDLSGKTNNIVQPKSVTTAKTLCSRCCTEILQITANLTDGHCMPCANALARAKEPVPDYIRRKNPAPILDHRNPEGSVILSVFYHPGFTPDLTSWTIQITSEGVIRQTVRWYHKEHKEEELLAPVTLDNSQLADFQRLIDLCASDTFKVLENAACIDDAAIVSLILPQKEIQIDLPYFDLQHSIKKRRQRFNEAEQSAFALFGQLWRLVDHVSPHSLTEHQKARTKRRS